MRAFVSLILLVLTGCGLSTGTPVHFVVPDGYRGPFYLIPDPTNGVVITKSQGRFVVTLPASGRLMVRDLGFLDSWHQETCAFASGTRIPTLTEPGSTGVLATNAVALRGSGSARNSNGPVFTWYFIGTQQEFDASGKLQP
ncbi:MAG TPA: hypothetical protein VGH19_20405 [Verrucomicrobiae bacterium]